MRKVNPSLTAIAAYQKVAYGDGVVLTTECVNKVREELVSTAKATTPPPRVLPTAEVTAEGDEHTGIPQEGRCVDADLVVSDDGGMSVDDSDEDQTISDGFSKSGDSGSEGESVVSRGSRKRTAEGSPEREPAETTRKSFPGAVTRSDAGCRIYVPPVTLEGDREKDKTGFGTTGAGVVETSGVSGVDAPGVGCVETSAASGVGTTGAGSVDVTIASGLTASISDDDRSRVVESVTVHMRTTSSVIGTMHVAGDDCGVLSSKSARTAESTDAGHGCGGATPTCETRVTASLAANIPADVIIMVRSAVPSDETEICKMAVPNEDSEAPVRMSKATEEPLKLS